MAKVPHNPIERTGLEQVTEGGWLKPITSKLKSMTQYDFWKSGRTGGKAALQGMKQIGGQSSDVTPDVLSYISGIDPSNSSGSVPEALDIMQKFRDVTNSDDLFASIAPLQSILGDQLYSAVKKNGNKTKTRDKTKREIPVIKKLIEAAIDDINNQDKQDRAVDLLNINEINNIKQAYHGNGNYTSNREIPEFVRNINKLIPIFRKQYGR